MLYRELKESYPQITDRERRICFQSIWCLIRGQVAKTTYIIPSLFFSFFSVVPGLEQGEPGRVISPPLSPDYRQRERRGGLAPCLDDDSSRDKKQRRHTAFLLFFLFVLCGTWARAGRARTSNIPSIIPRLQTEREGFATCQYDVSSGDKYQRRHTSFLLSSLYSLWYLG